MYFVTDINIAALKSFAEDLNVILSSVTTPHCVNLGIYPTPHINNITKKTFLDLWTSGPLFVSARHSSSLQQKLSITPASLSRLQQQ